jgi:hypothetical protein
MRDVPIIDIPAKTQRALRLYIEKGDTVDPFLRCVLCNDLAGAVTRADKENLVALPIIAQWLYSQAPEACWGTEAKHLRWMQEHPRKTKIGPQEV